MKKHALKVFRKRCISMWNKKGGRFNYVDELLKDVCFGCMIE